MALYFGPEKRARRAKVAEVVANQNSSAETLLLVDDDRGFRKVYGRLLSAQGYEILEADDRPSAAKVFEEKQPGVVLLDLMLPPDGSVQGGLKGLQEMKAQQPGAKIIVISGAGDTRFMLQALEAGAYDFLTKPVDPDVVQVVVKRAMARRVLESQIEELRNSLTQTRPESSMVGQSPAFQEAVHVAERVAPTDLPVLITGENGTGKELMARRVHEASRRKAGAFVAINCGALPESLLASTLFGHEKGAFTGAVQKKKGLFQEAHEGTLFLDEVGDMPTHLQVQLLRALETGDILPVGASKPVTVDVRIISATNQDLESMSQEGTFREDLYWRIKGAQVHLPPLRERRGDLELLATHFLNDAASLTAQGRPRRLSPEALALLEDHHWPGNLRELRHEMQRATVMSATAMINPQDLSIGSAGRGAQRNQGRLSLQDGGLQEQVEVLERALVALALKECAGNRTHAAEALGLSRQGLLNKIERYGF